MAHKEELELNRQILEDLKKRQEIIREEINKIKSNIKGNAFVTLNFNSYSNFRILFGAA